MEQITEITPEDIISLLVELGIDVDKVEWPREENMWSWNGTLSGESKFAVRSYFDKEEIEPPEIWKNYSGEKCVQPQSAIYYLIWKDKIPEGEYLFFMWW